MRSILVSTLVCLCSVASAADLELASPFSDHMVLQREMPVPVWGWSAPGDTVTVAFAEQTKTATADKTGRWQVTLDPLKASATSRTLAVQSEMGNRKLAIADVLVGEVWVCSGQSNMQMGRTAMIGAAAMLKKAAGRPIRSMTVTQTVRFTPRDRCDGKWTTAPSASAVAFAFQYYLQEQVKVPVGVIVTCWGSSSLEGWIPLDLAERLPHFKQAMARFEKEDRAKVTALLKQEAAGKKWARNDNIYLRTRPNILYNAMLHPLAPVAVRGLVWYQGESNTRDMASMLQYGVSLAMWCDRLRKQWGTDDFHLLAVMLPRFGRVHKTGPSQATDAPDAHSWAWFREAQLRLLDLPHTGVANTIDLGDIKNIHPKDKAPIGKRLALLAARDVNGLDVVAEGPTFAKAIVDGKTIRVQFKHAAGLKTTDGKPPSAFWVAGKDRKWHPAEARIDGEAVVLQSPAVPAPAVVRYAFAAFPDVNLLNAANLPAVPFRTDADKP